MTFTNFTLDVDADGIALVTWAMPERSANLLDIGTIEDLARIVETVAADGAIKGAVITSGKDTFCLGADLKLIETLAARFAGPLSPQQAEADAIRLLEDSRLLSRLYRRLETCGKPWVAAINGTAVGGGFELALACHHRIAADAANARLGLPEIKVGLFPGAGGTQRIARLLPPADALRFLLKGDLIKVARAKTMKLIDDVVAPGELVGAAKAWIRNGGRAQAPWDAPGFKLPGGAVFSKSGMVTFAAANALYRRETYDNYPAARAILQVVYEGLQLPMDLALTVESRWFAHILRSPEARAMMRTLFVSLQELNKGARRPPGLPPSVPRRIGIVGAGFMGSAIAYVSAGAGMEVALVDRDQAIAEKGKAQAEKLAADRVAKGRSTAAERDVLVARIAATADYAALSGCDLVIEAVFEDRKVKAETIGKLSGALREEAIVGSNTSTLPITSLAAGFADPARFIGIHFFSPVEKMPLVEIIPGKQTAAATLARAFDYVRAIGKTPIVVNDSRGFYTSRVVAAYIREGHLMLMEGVPPAMIENVARMAGMPVGPLALNDEVALDLAWRIVQATEADLGPRAVDAQQKALLQQMVEAHGRYGRKNGKGFYDYPERAPKRLWAGLAQLQPLRLDPDAVAVEELKRRFLVVQAIETARCLEQQVLTDVREADVGSILGFGFAPFTGGTASYIDAMGAKSFVALCRALQRKLGERFRPPRLLIDLAANGQGLYQRFAPAPRGAP